MGIKQQLKYRAYRFSIKAIKFSAQLPEKKVFWIVAAQLLRSAASIGVNIIETQAANSKEILLNFLKYH